MADVNPNDLLARFFQDLQPWVESQKGTCHLAVDELHALTLLNESPAGWRVIVSWDGEENLSEVADIFMVEQRVTVFVSSDPGLTADPDKNLAFASATRSALLDLVADVRKRVQSQTWDGGTTAQYWRYQGAAVARLPNGIPLRAYRMTFAIDTTQPAVTDRTVAAQT